MALDLFLAERHVRELTEILASHVPHAEVWAYGSRVTGGAHAGSDLDIVLRNPINLEVAVTGKSELVEAIEMSLLPMLIDVSDWAALPTWLREDIAKAHVVLR